MAVSASKERLALALKRATFAMMEAKEQREQERDDLRFQVPEFQWSDESRRWRGPQNVQGLQIPERPTLAIDQLSQPASILENQIRRAHLGVGIHPISADANDDTAEVFQGIYNQIQRDSRANIARLWAVARAIRAGWGCYRINTKYADEYGGDPFDQVITIDRILHQDSVYFDPAAQAADFSDAQYAFIMSWIPEREFKRLYPKKAVPTADDFAEGGEATPQWTKGEDDKAAVRIAEYFYKETEKQKLVMLERSAQAQNGEMIPAGTAVREISEGEYQTLDDVPLLNAVVREGLSREREVTKVYWCKITGNMDPKQGFLEGPVELNGRYIPIVVVLGRELQPFDERRRWVGIINGAKDAQSTFNHAVSSMVERAALEPKAPYVGDPRQFEQFKSWWQYANILNFPYLPAQLVVDGQVLPPPQRTEVSAAAMTPSMALVQMAQDGIRAATSTFAPSLGDYDSRDRSGKSIQLLQQEGDLSNSDYMHQLVTVSMTLEAMIVLDMIPYIYDRPGRIVRTVDDEEQTDKIMVNQPYVLDPRDKQPIPYREGMPLPPKDPRSGEPPEIKNYNLRSGVYGVSVTIGRGYQTRMQEGAEHIGKLLQAAPDLLQFIGDIYMDHLDFAGAPAISERLKKWIKAKNPGLIEDDDAQTPPAEMLMQQMQAMKQELDQAKMALQTKQIEQQAKLQTSQMDNETKLVIARMENQTKLLTTRITALTDIMEQQLENRQRSRSESESMVHEANEARAQMAHEVAMDAQKAEREPMESGE